VPRPSRGLALAATKRSFIIRDIFKFIGGKMLLKKISGQYIRQDISKIVFKSP